MYKFVFTFQVKFVPCPQRWGKDLVRDMFTKYCPPMLKIMDISLGIGTEDSALELLNILMKRKLKNQSASRHLNI